MPKHDPSEKTKSDILKTAMRLFREKGFENVNIEDIVKELGMTRGAFYHYFKSREGLIYAAVDQMFFEKNPFDIAAKKQELNALEKLRFIFKFQISPDMLQSELQVMHALQKVLADPVILKSEIFSQVHTVAPFLEKLLIEGNEDGSLSVLYPKQTAQALSVLSSVWLSPTVFEVPFEEFVEKISFLEHLTKQLGVPIIDDEIRELILQRYQLIYDI